VYSTIRILKILLIFVIHLLEFVFGMCFYRRPVALETEIEINAFYAFNIELSRFLKALSYISEF
jgi:hypothetical protein